MIEDQQLRLTAVQMAIEAKTPWDRVTEVADKIMAYIRGPGAQPTTSTLDLFREARRQQQAGVDIEADKGTPIEEHERDWDRIDPDGTMRQPIPIPPEVRQAAAEVIDRGEPVEEPVPAATVAEDPRLPKVTM